MLKTFLLFYYASIFYQGLSVYVRVCMSVQSILTTPPAGPGSDGLSDGHREQMSEKGRGGAYH